MILELLFNKLYTFLIIFLFNGFSLILLHVAQVASFACLSSFMSTWLRIGIVDEAFYLLNRHPFCFNDFSVGDFLDKLGLDLFSRLPSRRLGPCYDLSVAHDIIKVAILASNIVVNSR